MKDKTGIINMRIIIGSFWIYIGTIFLLAKISGGLVESSFIIPINFVSIFIFSIFLITMGILFLLKIRFAAIAILVLSIVMIIGTWGLAGKMIIYGISDIVKFQTPGSCIRLAFGLIVLFSSFPFLIIIYVQPKLASEPA